MDLDKRGEPLFASTTMIRELREPDLISLADFLLLHGERFLDPISDVDLLELHEPVLLNLADFISLQHEGPPCPFSPSDLIDLLASVLLSLAYVIALHGEGLLSPVPLVDLLDTHLDEQQERDDFLDLLLALLSIPDLPESKLFKLADSLGSREERLLDLDLHSGVQLATSLLLDLLGHCLISLVDFFTSHGDKTLDFWHLEIVTFDMDELDEEA